MNEVTENNYTCFLSSPIKAYLPQKQTCLLPLQKCGGEARQEAECHFITLDYVLSFIFLQQGKSFFVNQQVLRKARFKKKNASRHHLLRMGKVLINSCCHLPPTTCHTLTNFRTLRNFKGPLAQ